METFRIDNTNINDELLVNKTINYIVESALGNLSTSKYTDDSENTIHVFENDQARVEVTKDVFITYSEKYFAAKMQVEQSLLEESRMGREAANCFMMED